MKELCLNKNGVTYTPLKYWILNDDTKIATYQGSRGDNPDLDFIVKYKEQSKRLRLLHSTDYRGIKNIICQKF